jgi:nucleotide-binding universal stress UspA family protein
MQDSAAPQVLKVLIAGTSLDMASDRVVLRAAELAKASGAALHLVHAHALPMALFGATTGLSPVPPDLLDAERQVRLELLSQQVERVGLSEADVAGSWVEAGAPHRTLLEAADRLAADLIVVGGTDSGGGFQILGSNADRVLRKAHCPVWVVSGTPLFEPARWLAPVDLSDLAADSLGRGLALLQEVHADRPTRLEAFFVLTAGEVEAEPHREPDQLLAQGADELRRFVAGVPGAGHAQCEIRLGDVRAEILKRAEELDAHLVLGTHGRSGFERFLLGSVAADVAAKARRDVLVVPPLVARD